MELIRGIHNLATEHRGCVLTVGNFDGVHRGHREVLKGLQQQGKLHETPTCVMTFEPQPLEFFAHDRAPARLMGFRDKFRCLAELGIDRLLVLPFNRKLANMEAEEFVRHVLVDGLAVKHIVIGDEAEDWDEVLVVEYPSRDAFFDMVTNPDYMATTHHRTAALERSALIASKRVL